MEELIQELSACQSTTLAFDGSTFKIIMFGGSNLCPDDVMERLDSSRSTYSVSESLLPATPHLQDVHVAVFTFRMSEMARHRDTLINAIIDQFHPV